jgi:hypothetical protein
MRRKDGAGRGVCGRGLWDGNRGEKV